VLWFFEKPSIMHMPESIPFRPVILIALALMLTFAPTLFLIARRSIRLATEVVVVRTLDSILLALTLTPTHTSFAFDLVICVRSFFFFEPLPFGFGLGLPRTQLLVRACLSLPEETFFLFSLPPLPPKSISVWV
jgi:hypothetical protein